MRSLLTGLFVPRQVGWILARCLLQFTTFRVARKHPLSISGQSVEGLLHNPRAAAALAVSAESKMCTVVCVKHSVYSCDTKKVTLTVTP